MKVIGNVTQLGEDFFQLEKLRTIGEAAKEKSGVEMRRAALYKGARLERAIIRGRGEGEGVNVKGAARAQLRSPRGGRKRGVNSGSANLKGVRGEIL